MTRDTTKRNRFGERIAYYNPDFILLNPSIYDELLKVDIKWK